MAAAGPAILLHLELAVQSLKVPREPILITENEGEKIVPRFARTDQHFTPLHTAFGSVQWIMAHPMSFTVIRP